MESLAALSTSSCDAGLAVGAGAGPLAGLAAGSICVGSSAAVRSSVVVGGQAGLPQLARDGPFSSPSNQPRHDGSTEAGDSWNRLYSVSTNAGLTPPAISLKS